MTDKLRAACIALLKSAPDHIINEHWPELDEIIKALAEPDKREQQLQFAIKRGDKANAYAMELQKRLRQYEKGSPMGLNAEPNTMDAQRKRNQSPPVRNPAPQQPKLVEFYVYEWISALGVVFRSFRPDEPHMGRDPDRTIAFPEPHTGIDRGAWSDVPDATKWVDELRGDEDLEEPPNSTTDVVKPIGEVQIQKMGRPFNASKVVLHFYDEPPPVGTKLYAAPPKPDLINQTCCECGKSGGYALYCGDCWGKATRREWQPLTSEEKSSIRDAVPYSQFMSAGEYAVKVQDATEAKLREKNA